MSMYYHHGDCGGCNHGDCGGCKFGVLVSVYDKHGDCGGCKFGVLVSVYYVWLLSVYCMCVFVCCSTTEFWVGFLACCVCILCVFFFCGVVPWCVCELCRGGKCVSKIMLKGFGKVIYGDSTLKKLTM